MQSHIKNLIKDVDKAIAYTEGIEILEEQLQEFRDTSSFFDNDNTKTLKPFELKVSLTTLGENFDNGYDYSQW